MIFMLFLFIILAILAILTYLGMRYRPDMHENDCPWCGGVGYSSQGIRCFKCGGSGSVKND